MLLLGEDKVAEFVSSGLQARDSPIDIIIFVSFGARPEKGMPISQVAGHL